MASEVGAAYSRRAADYVQVLGSMASVHPSDRALVRWWAGQVDGTILDAGCGPGHWAGYLVDEGLDARGIDQVPDFISHARETHPRVTYTVGSIDALPDGSATLGGVLAWYSLIHHEPTTIHTPLEEFSRVVRPGGRLLVGFFTGPDVEPFDHAVTTAYRWPPQTLALELESAGFDVVETHTRTGSQLKPRPHGTILAVKPPESETPTGERSPAS
jgi:SAM-dependent methyltransferase